MAAVLEQIKPRYQGKKVTREQYLDLTEDGFKYDMIEGVLYMSPSAFYRHGRLVTNFLAMLYNYNKEHKVGEIVTEVDVLLPDGGDILRPDISFILKENLSIVEKHIHGAPDLLCEVLSTSTKERDLGIKADRYLANGVNEYWILDPEEESIMVWYNETSSWEKKEGTILKSKLLSGFTVNHTDLWDDEF